MESEFCGVGALERFLADLQADGRKRFFAVASRSTLERQHPRLGWLAALLGPDAVFSDFSPNPAWEEILRAREACRVRRPELILAIGGGSAIDVAKAVFCSYPGNPFGTDGSDAPLIALPTTAGSGSEATHFAVYYRGAEKHSLAHPDLVPDVAVVDPLLSTDMPPTLTAVTGLDALSQAIEALWAVGATAESSAFAAAAVRKILPAIEDAVGRPDLRLRTAMALGANLAGKAINISTTTAPHALAYYVTKRYGVPHGQAVAVMLPFFFLVNAGPAGSDFSPAATGEYSPAFREIASLLGCDTPEACVRRWRRLVTSCGLAATPAELGFGDREALEQVVAHVNLERLANNPVRFKPDDLVELMLTALGE